MGKELKKALLLQRLETKILRLKIKEVEIDFQGEKPLRQLLEEHWDMHKTNRFKGLRWRENKKSLVLQKNGKKIGKVRKVSK